MDHHQVEAFVVLAEELHFGRASERLYISTPSLSRRISDLERDLGLRLFDRTSRRVGLTPAGAFLIDHARKAMEDIRAMRQIAKDLAAGRSGKLFALYSPGNGSRIASLVQLLHHDRPAVEVTIEQRVSDDVVAAIVAGEADVGLCRDLREPGLGFVTMARYVPDTVVMAKTHRLADRPVIQPSDLAGETILQAQYTAHFDTPRPETYALVAAGATIRYQRLTSESEVLDRVAAGSSLACVQSDLLRRNPRNDVVDVPYDSGSRLPPSEHRLIWRIDNDDPVVRSLIEIARSIAPDELTPSPGRGATAPQPQDALLS